MAPLNRRLAAIIALLVGTAALIHNITSRGQSHSPVKIVRKTHPHTFGSQKSEPPVLNADAQVISTTTAWQQLREHIRAQANDDEAGLTNSYLRAREMIAAEYNNDLSHLRAEVQYLLQNQDSGLKELFFVVSAYTRYWEAPERILRVIQDLSQNLQLPTSGATISESHHETLTTAVKYRRIEAYAAKVLRRRLVAGFRLTEESQAEAIAQISHRIREEKSMDIVLEYFDLLAHWNAEQAIQQALSIRSLRERKLIEEYLATPLSNS